MNKDHDYSVFLAIIAIWIWWEDLHNAKAQVILTASGKN